jgi:endonuclease IV
MIGIQICMLPGNTFEETAGIFRHLQARFSISACEIHLERSLYPSAIWPWETSSHEGIANLRSSVDRLGVHLPFMDMNPISSNPRVAEASRRILEESLEFASRNRADYAVFHARGCGGGSASRERELQAWRKVIAGLGEKASSLALVFCLENADDLRDMSEVRPLLTGMGDSIKLCLDLGHLFERRYPASFLSRMALALNDRLSPFPFAFKNGLPVQRAQEWHQTLNALAPETACVHLHNHDGRTAHRRLRHGKIDLNPLRQLKNRLHEIPVILEADYSHSDIHEISEDLAYMEKLLK